VEIKDDFFLRNQAIKPPLLETPRTGALTKSLGLEINPENIGKILRHGVNRNSVFSAVGQLVRDAVSIPRDDEGFDPFTADNGAYLKGYEAYPSEFANVRNRRWGDYMKRRIDAERKRDSILQTTPFGVLGEFFGDILNPSSALALKPLRFIQMVAGEELVQQHAQVTLTGEESFMNVGASVLLGGSMALAYRRVPELTGSLRRPPERTLGLPGPDDAPKPPPGAPEPPPGPSRPTETANPPAPEPVVSGDPLLDAYERHMRDVRVMEEEQAAAAAVVPKVSPEARTAEAPTNQPAPEPPVDIAPIVEQIERDRKVPLDPEERGVVNKAYSPEYREPGSPGERGSVGAAASGDIGPERSAIKNAMEDADFEKWGETPLWAGNIDKIPISPLLRGLESRSTRVRQITQDLVDNSLFLNKHTLGEATVPSVESQMRQHFWPTAEAITEIGIQYDLYRGGTGDGGMIQNAKRGINDFMAPNAQALSPTEFRGEVGKALHTGDKHYIPQVQAAAVAIRKVLDGYKKQLMDSDLIVAPYLHDMARLRDNLKGAGERASRKILAEMKIISDEIDRLRKEGPQPGTDGESFFATIYRHDRIMEDLPGFKNIIRDHLRTKSVPDGRLEKDVEEIVQGILRMKPYTPVDEDAIGRARSLRQRSLDIPRSKLFDFIELDAEAVLRYYSRTVSADLELHKRFGDVTMKEQLDEVTSHFNELIDQATSGKQRADLLKERNMHLKDIRAMRDRLRGTYGLPDDPFRLASRAMRGVKQYNYITQMGRAVVASIPDLGRIVMTEGIERAFRDAFIPLFRNLDGIKLNAREAKIAGNVLEMEMGFRAQAMAELGDTFGRHSPFERALLGSSGMFSIVNLFNPWNAALKSMAAGVISTRIIEDSLITSAPFLRSQSAKMVAVDSIPSAKADREISAKYNRETNIVTYSESALKKSFSEKAWLNPKMAGVEPLSDDLIRNFEDWKEFVINHEMAHADYPKLLEEADFPEAYENRMNRVAANRMLMKRYNRTRDLSKFGREKLARAGIDGVLADRIARQFEQYGSFAQRGENSLGKPLGTASNKGGEMLNPNTAEWTDWQAQEAYRLALGADIDRAIVTPGAGDRPLWMSTELGSVIGQYKAFSVAAAQRVLIPALQQKDSEIMMGLVSMVALGVVVDQLSRSQYDYGDNPTLADRLVSGIDRSGVLGYFSDINRMVETLSDNRLGLNSVLGIAPPHGSSGRQKVGTLLGPTASTFSDFSTVLTDSLSNDVDQATAGALRRIVPANNVFYAMPLFDAIAAGAKE
jgi:hypothetical protein